MDSKNSATKGDTWTCFKCSHSTSNSNSLVKHIQKFHDKALGTPNKTSVTKNAEKKTFGIRKSTLVKPCLLTNQDQVKICFVQLEGFKCPKCLYFASNKHLICEHSQNEHEENNNLLFRKASKIAKSDKVPKPIEILTKNVGTKTQVEKKFGILQSTVNPCLLKNQVQLKTCSVQLKGFKCHECLYFASTKDLLCEHSQTKHNENKNIVLEKKSKNAELEQVTKAMGISTRNSVNKKQEKKMSRLLRSTINPCRLGNQVQVKTCSVPLKSFKCPECVYFASTKDLLCEHSQKEHDENNNVLFVIKSKIAKSNQVTKLQKKVAKSSRAPKPSLKYSTRWQKRQ